MTHGISIGNFQPLFFSFDAYVSSVTLTLFDVGDEIRIKFTRSKNRQINLYSYDTYQREEEENAIHNVYV